MSRLAAILLLIIAAAARAQVAAPPAPAPSEISILIAPLRAIGDDGKTAWISQAIQQNLFNDLTRMQSVHPILPAEPVANTEAALKAAKSANATHLFEGSYQLADPGIRITAQILDLRTNQYIGAAKATGALRDLFALEDSIADQVKRIIARQIQIQSPPLAPQPNAADVAIKPDGPVQKQFPWDRDKGFIAEARRQNLLDSGYEDSLYRTTYTYGIYNYSSYYSGYSYQPYYYRPWRYRGYFGGAAFFPGGVIRFGRW